MAEDLLNYICNDLYGEKVEAGEPVNILKVWVGQIIWRHLTGVKPVMPDTRRRGYQYG